MDAADLDRRARTLSGCIPPSLVSRLLELGHGEQVELQAGKGEWFRAREWARLLGDRGRQAHALEVLLPYVATGWWPAVQVQAELLEGWGRSEEAIALARPYARVGGPALEFFARLLARNGHKDEAIRRLSAGIEDWLLAAALVDVAEGTGRDEEVAVLLTATATNWPICWRDMTAWRNCAHTRRPSTTDTPRNRSGDPSGGAYCRRAAGALEAPRVRRHGSTGVLLLLPRVRGPGGHPGAAGDAGEAGREGPPALRAPARAGADRGPRPGDGLAHHDQAPPGGLGPVHTRGRPCAAGAVDGGSRPAGRRRGAAAGRHKGRTGGSAQAHDRRRVAGPASGLRPPGRRRRVVLAAAGALPARGARRGLAGVVLLRLEAGGCDVAGAASCARTSVVAGTGPVGVRAAPSAVCAGRAGAGDDAARRAGAGTGRRGVARESAKAGARLPAGGAGRGEAAQGRRGPVRPGSP